MYIKGARKFSSGSADVTTPVATPSVTPVATPDATPVAKPVILEHYPLKFVTLQSKWGTEYS